MNRKEVLPLVQQDLEARIQKGAVQYGEPLTTHNGRDALWDAYEEALDLSLYLMQAIEERKDLLAVIAKKDEALRFADLPDRLANCHTYDDTQNCYDHIEEAYPEIWERLDGGCVNEDVQLLREIASERREESLAVQGGGVKTHVNHYES